MSYINFPDKDGKTHEKAATSNVYLFIQDEYGHYAQHGSVCFGFLTEWLKPERFGKLAYVRFANAYVPPGEDIINSGYEQFFQWVTKGSPFKDVFINPVDANTFRRTGIQVSLDFHVSYIITSMMVLRNAGEYPCLLSTWRKLVNEFEVDPYIAYVISTTMSASPYTTVIHGSGHRTYYSQVPNFSGLSQQNILDIKNVATPNATFKVSNKMGPRPLKYLSPLLQRAFKLPGRNKISFSAEQVTANTKRWHAISFDMKNNGIDKSHENIQKIVRYFTCVD